MSEYTDTLLLLSALFSVYVMKDESKKKKNLPAAHEDMQKPASGGATGKNLPANAGDTRDVGLIPGLGRFPGEGHGNPLQYSCLENPMDRGACWATVHRVAKSWTRLKRLNTHIVTKLKKYCLRETNQASVSETKKICHNFNLPFFHYVSLNNFILSYC